MTSTKRTDNITITDKNMPNPTNKSYANITKQVTFPKKEQAIIMMSIDGIKIKEYITKIGEIVGPKNILFASRISNNRICIYLSSKQQVDQIINPGKSIKIDDHTINIRRLITPAKRIILSNVCPTIPHETIETVIKELGLTTVSPISFLRVGMLEGEYSHILSFRRQIYVTPDEKVPIPETIIVEYEDTTYRIFITEDTVTCFLCKQKGHTTNQCQNQPPETIQTQASQNNPPKMPTTQNMPFLNPTPATKRTSSEITNSDASSSQENTSKQPTDTLENKNKTELTKNKQITKKIRSESPPNQAPLEEIIKPLKEIIKANPDKYILSFEELSDFLENVRGSNDPLNIAKEYTEEIPQLITMMTELYPHITQRSMKSKFTRITQKIKLQLLEPDKERHSSQESLTKYY